MGNFLIPDEAMKELVKYCEEHDIGMAAAKTDDITVIIMGDKDFTPIQVSIIAAYILLRGIVSGDMATADMINTKGGEILN